MCTEFTLPVTRDLVAGHRACEWCGLPATCRLTAIGGLRHNQSGCFCDACGARYTRIVSEASPPVGGMLPLVRTQKQVLAVMAMR